MILYDEKEQLIAVIDTPFYSSETDKNYNVTKHCFNADINFEYKDNPIDLATNQLTKISFKPFYKCFRAENTRKEDALRYFEQDLIRFCGSNTVEIDNAEANRIRASWVS